MTARIDSAKRLARSYNDKLIARGVHDREWFVTADGDLRMRSKALGQRRFDMGERR